MEGGRIFQRKIEQKYLLLAAEVVRAKPRGVVNLLNHPLGFIRLIDALIGQA